MKLQSLVNKPLTIFSKLKEKDGNVVLHDNYLYHKEALKRAQDFLNSFDYPEKNIKSLIDEDRSKKILENRNRLVPIIQTIIFIGKQNISLRGNRDDGSLIDSEQMCNEGNFRELLRFKIISGDKILQQHFETAHWKATYISKTAQNKLINWCRDEIRNSLIKRIKSSKLYEDISVYNETGAITSFRGNIL